MRIFLIVLLLTPITGFTQSSPLYLADGLNDFSDQMIRGTNPVYVTVFGQDSLIISTAAGACEHASAYKRNSGESFLRRTQAWGTSLPNVVFVDQNAMVLVEKGGRYLLLKDRDNANAMLAASDKSSVVRMKDNQRSIVTDIANWQREENNRVAAERNWKIVTADIRGFRSRRNDPAIINHPNGKCFIQWRAFGYEALGGGDFSKDLITYNKSDFYGQATGASGSMRLERGVAYKIDCD